MFLKSPPLERLPEFERGPVLACYRALFAAAFLAPFVSRDAIRFRPMLVPMSLSFAAMNLLFVTAMTRTTAGAAIFLQYTSTVWAFGLGWLFFHERIDRKSLATLACVVAGIVCIVAGETSSAHFIGNLIALASGLSYAGVIVSLRALRGENAAWLIALNHLVSGLVLLPWVLTLDVSLDAAQWSLVALLGIVQMALPYVLFARGVRTVSAQDAALLTLIEPVLNPVWVWLFWRERVEYATWIGGALILGGLALRYLQPAGRRPTIS